MTLASLKKGKFGKIIELWMSPFGKGLPILVMFYLSFMFSVIYWKSVGAVFYFLTVNLFVAWIMTLILVQTKGILHRILFVLFLLLAVFWNISDCSVGILYHMAFGENMAMAIVATNSNEITEFLECYLSGKVCIVILFEWLFIILTYFLVKKYVRLNCVIKCLLSIMILMALALIIRSPQSLNFTIIGKTTMLVTATQQSPDLREYPTYPCIVVDENEQPQRIVVIVGKSLTDVHCSLYGYEKNTNLLVELN